MQATTSGETLKRVDVYNKKVILDFLSNEKAHFYRLKNKNALYQNKTMINTAGLNYLNILPENDIESTLKNMILKEYNDCEALYPYVGDIFLNMFFESKTSIKSLFRFEKKDQEKFLTSLRDVNAKNILEWLFNNTSLERNINIQSYSGKEICFEMENDMSINVGYDYDFFRDFNNLTFRNYKFVLINGYVESVGEIHHLFTNANKSKIPHVLFCYGMSEEVKHNILVNNRQGRFIVLPISLDANDENSLNILNDIAVIHDGVIISSDMGQTISQEVRKDLPTGKKITFLKNKIYIDPVCDDRKIYSHKKFLLKRLEEAKEKHDVNTDPIENRVKNFSSKRLNIYIPESLKRHASFQRELIYGLKFLNNINKEYKILYMNKREYYVPSNIFKISKNKSKSLKATINNIEIVITWGKNGTKKIRKNSSKKK